MFFVVFLFSVLISSGTSYAVTCGTANGFPPFQFDDKGKPTGIDVDILRQSIDEVGGKLDLRQKKWDDVVALLRLGEIDCVAGMEINEPRLKMFDFTKPIYKRRNALFVLRESATLNSVEDLLHKKIAGDRQSFLEQLFEEKKLLNKTRLIRTPSKFASMEMLKKKEVDAVIAPFEVGHYLANELGVKVRVIDDLDPGTPVGIAVKKGDTKLLERLNRGLETLLKRDAFKKIFEKWLGHKAI